jgi:cytochrome c oxidase subunit 3
MTPARVSAAALPRAGAYPAGLMGVLATVTMLFAAFTAALLVRRAGHDWAPIELPRLVWVNAAVILASSIAIEMGRQTAVLPLSLMRVATGLVLGVLFLAGQILAWRALAARGVFLPTSPHAAFFYLLSGVHGAHVLAGIGALAWAVRGLRRAPHLPVTRAVLTHVSVFWHFVGALWLYLLFLLTLL